MHAKIPDLLQYTQTLRYYEDKLAHARGDRFNIFALLGVERLEVATHTPYIVEFLNRDGVHGLGSRPLEAFLRRFDMKLNPATTVVKTNHRLGPVTDHSGGLVDILLEDQASTRQVVIENKIHHGDGPNQLERYRGSLKHAQIVYLTLDGRKPSDYSTRNKEGILCLSYAQNILAWQEDCHREAAGAPLVRETITQYINLIKRLTGQTTNTYMSAQIVESVLKNEASLAAYYELFGTERAIRAKIIATLRTQCDEIARPLGLEVKFDDGLLDEKESSFYFRDASMREQHIWITFMFESSNYYDFFFGIRYDDSNDSHFAPPGLLDAFKGVFGGGTSTEWWAAWKYWDSRSHWNIETYADIVSGRFQPELEDKVKKLLDVVRSAQSLQQGLSG